ncbi:hypothetical protein WN51_11764 [Melipona quadrifasciata]|uniref:Uncharacterized protein n=1 Tax=Melipona quadrifasciata TaxID=166423 RepID=A0A0N0U607_9HYME|nr:hypothetical protein WN51_11764 [Melipona quadrifasciata]
MDFSLGERRSLGPTVTQLENKYKNVTRWIRMRFGKHGEKYIHKGAMRMVELDVQLEFRRVSCLYRARCVNGVTEGTSDRVLGEIARTEWRIKEREARMGNVGWGMFWYANEESGRKGQKLREKNKTVAVEKKARCQNRPSCTISAENKECMCNVLTPLTSLLRLSPPKSCDAQNTAE